MKKITVFIDGSCMNGGGAGVLGGQGPSGWAAIFTGAGKVLKELGGSYRKSSSSAMEEKAFKEAIKAWSPESGIHLEIVTDYLAHLQALEAIAKGKSELGYASKTFVKEVKELLESKGVKVHPKTSARGTTVVSACNTLSIVKVKAHAHDKADAETLGFYVLGNIASDKSAKNWASKALV